MLRFQFVVILLLFAIRSSAQISFERSLFHSDGIQVNDITTTEDNGFALVGEHRGGISLVKLDSAYDIQWEKIIRDNIAVGETGIRIINTRDGGYLVIVRGLDPNLLTPDITILKTDSIGNPLWCKSIGAAQDDYAYDVIETSDSSFVFTGYSDFLGPILQGDLLLMKMDQLGQLTWAKTLGGLHVDIGRRIFEINNGYFSIGYSESYTSYRIHLLNTDTSGTVRWAMMLGSFNDRLMDGAITSDSDTFYPVFPITISDCQTIRLPSW